MTEPMSKEEVKLVLNNPHKPLVLFAIAYYVNLNDRELNTLIYRYLRGHTQEETAEYLERSKNTIQNWENSALETCAKAWSGNQFVAQLLEY